MIFSKKGKQVIMSSDKIFSFEVKKSLKP